MTGKSDDQIYKDFGVRLKQLRRSNNITQKDLAEHMNVSQTAIAQYESGTRKLPLSVLKKFARYFNLTLDQLIYSDIVPNKSDSLDNPVNPNFKQKLENNIKSLREAKNVTLYELANEIHIDVSLLDRYEKGLEVVPIDTLEKISNFLNVSVAQLTTVGLITSEETTLITSNAQIAKLQKKWFDNVKEVLTDEEMDQVIDFANYLINKRNKV